ncbi:adipokinetic hormone/corazonin-related peptide receptor variant I-like isoform X1 [Daphnia pulex]|uniref:adipokinetic hormone/corazonin-related peptide receptor variant I-like isoform X1 n=1 Tax=Daphnia pulex TaxID=6669 RepID=UPI001EDED8DD|nr:adipokinetic hormone/corazonin-related peptide receptor variant I-like isoform X1 [Daphnia pulex]XP_046439447.1 adipokinetic hormone/corazonin-related peptide receptor variant I-like isoform X1 [Daphnia pulex]XP_046439448.1 adipokinetic hormone/corazonin-related peptide receptor variant I-like isoform X1 [Daphnia pulex]
MCSNDSSSLSGTMCMMTERDASFSGESTVNPEFDSGSSISGGSSSSTTAVDLSMLPIDMTFNDGHVVSIATYSVLLIISVCGNITVLVNLIKRRHISNPRVNIMLTHLAIADLLVTLLLMPIEIGWAATVQWRAGDFSCRILAFFRTFGLFLSSFVLVCISIDRFGAILQPMKLDYWKRRGRFMLAIAWACSVICSLPQVFVFHVKAHPEYPWYEQCVTFDSFPTKAHEISYAAFGMMMMYVLPLAVFVFTYSSILCEISRRSKEAVGQEEGIRRVTVGTLGRARIKTVKMTLVIISVFIFCWTPYNIMSIWFWCDRDSALQVDQRIQKGLFLFACTNSCFNPMVYGYFSRRTVRRSHHELHRKVVYHPSRMASRALAPSLRVDCNSKSLKEGAVTEPCLPQQHLPVATADDPSCQGQAEPIFTASSIAVAVKRSNSWLNNRSNPNVVTHIF